MNIDRLNELAAAIETMDMFPFKFNMNKWRNCILGCGIYMFNRDAYERVAGNEQYDMFCENMDIPREQIDTLCFPHGILTDLWDVVDNKHAVRAIHKFIETNGKHAWEDIAKEVRDALPERHANEDLDRYDEDAR